MELWEDFKTGVSGVGSVLTFGLLPIYGVDDENMTAWDRWWKLNEASNATIGNVLENPTAPFSTTVGLGAELGSQFLSDSAKRISSTITWPTYVGAGVLLYFLLKR